MKDEITINQVKKATKDSSYKTRQKAVGAFEGDKKMTRKKFDESMKSGEGGRISQETRGRIGGGLDKSGQASDSGSTQKKRTGIFGALFGSGSSRNESPRSGSGSGSGPSRSSSKRSRSYDSLREEFGGQKGPGYTSDRGGTSNERTSTSSGRGSSSSKTSVGGMRKLH